MRTTIDIPEDLIKEAMKLLKKKTKTETVEEALRQAIRREKIRDIKEFRGKINLNIDLDILRKR